MREYKWRVDAIRNGARLKTLKAIEPISVDASVDGEIPSSLQGNFLTDPDVDILNDELRPVQIIDDVEWPLGYYAMGSIRDQHTDEGLNIWRLEAYDRSYRVKQTKTESTLHLAAGTNYINAVKEMLLTAGVSLVLATDTSKVLATDREDWEIGTDYLTIVNTLLSEINYRPLWFNLDGWAMLHPAADPDADSVKHTYDHLTESSLVSVETESELDIFDAPNVFICVCQNPDMDEPMVATAENNSPLSKLSILARGRRIAQVYRVENIPDQATLDAYAERLCYESMTQAETITIKTAQMPGHELNDTVALNLPQIQGVFRETGWSVRLGAGEQMTHKLTRRLVI